MDFIGLSTMISELHSILLREDVLNKRQCINLVENIQKAVEAVEKISGSQEKDFLRPICEEFTWIMNKAKHGIEECCKEDWCHAALMQVNNKEFFMTLLLDLGHCFQTICEISRCRYLDQSEDITKVEERTTFYPSLLDEVEEDRCALCSRLQNHLDLHTTEHRELAQYLLGQVLALQKVEGGKLINIVFPDEYPVPNYTEPPIVLGRSGPTSTVYSTHWLEMKCATKVMDVKDVGGEQCVLKEAKLLRGLNHPNITKLFCCGFNAKQKQIELVMEEGIMDLSKILGDKKFLLSEVCALDIMIQIASGMYYLHDMKVAHRDLKPANIIVTAKANSSSNNVGNMHVKLVDFGHSKMEVKDFPEIPSGQQIYGTCGYAAPEAFENRSSEVDAFKTDVFSFGVVCYEILSRKRFFDASDSMKKYIEFTRSGLRPQLPKGCSMDLKSLINDCWAFEPTKRPKSIDIYYKLVLLKREMIKKAFQDRPINFYERFISYMSVQMIPRNWWINFHGCLLPTLASLQTIGINDVYWLWFMPQLRRSNIPMSLPIAHQKVNKEVKIGLKKKILELEKRLQTCGSLGIIGMGGVGKSTLAYALSEHVSHQFEATIFVSDLMTVRCTFLSRDKVKDLQSRAKVITLWEAHKLIQEMRRTKRILIVLDDVGSQSQLQELLGNDVLGYGSKLIASSRDWKSLEGYVKMDGKIEMHTLGGHESLELFFLHAFAGNQPCLPYLTNVVEKIVKACDGLPLSLKVMGIYLQGEKRLRIWERTLQRLLRGRYDGNIDERIWRTLRISFDELDNARKNLFLDIACFFCKDTCPGGVSKDTICTIFSDDDNLAHGALQSLIDKSLLKVGNDGLLDMHDHLRNMGRMIVEKEFKGSRMWNLHLSTFNDCTAEDLKFIQGLQFARLEQMQTCTTNLKLKNMKELRLLVINNCENADLISTILEQSTRLRWLNIKFPSTPSERHLQCIHEISKFMRMGQHQLQELRVLEIEGCGFLKLFPNESFPILPLKKMRLQNCEALEEFPSGLNNLVALEELDLSGCKLLRAAPEGFGSLTSLKGLRMSGCASLEEIPLGLNNLVALEELDLSGCKLLRAAPEGFGSLTSLKGLRMSGCASLEEIPLGLNNLVVLEELNLSWCTTLRGVLEGFGGLRSLKRLIMSNCELLEEIPSGLNNLGELEELDFSGCKLLRAASEGFWSLTSLKGLRMSGCLSLEEIPLGLKNLVALEELNLSWCTTLRGAPEGFGGLRSLKRLIMSNCELLEDIPSGLNNLGELEELDLSGSKVLRVAHEGFGGLTSLKRLIMSNCESLEEIPSGLNNMVELEELDLWGCKALRGAPEGFGGLRSLKRLIMWDCESLEEIPLGLNNLVALEELNLSWCTTLRGAPEGFGGLRSLKRLIMSNCELLEDIPSGLNNLGELEELDLSGSKVLRVAHEGFGGLTSLKKLVL